MGKQTETNKGITPPDMPGRRKAMGLLGAIGVGGTVGVGTLTTTDDDLAIAGVCVVAAQETGGPYPLVSVLDNANIYRRDITEGKYGIPLTLTLKIVDYDQGCTPLVGAAVYIWHCDAAGEYSGYSSTQNGLHSGEIYLRGVQTTDTTGRVTFKTIFPGWYIPRLTHIHVQVFASGTTLTSSGVALATTQVCFPDAITTAAYSKASYYPKGQNTVTPTWPTDQVFGNGIGSELLTVSGSANSGYVAGIVLGLSSNTSSPSSGDASSSAPPGGTAPTGPTTPPGGTPPALPA